MAFHEALRANAPPVRWMFSASKLSSTSCLQGRSPQTEDTCQHFHLHAALAGIFHFPSLTLRLRQQSGAEKPNKEYCAMKSSSCK